VKIIFTMVVVDDYSKLSMLMAVLNDIDEMEGSGNAIEEALGKQTYDNIIV
jgi:hypothetical protein